MTRYSTQQLVKFICLGCILIATSRANSQDLLLQPSHFNDFRTCQLLSDSTVRVFGIVQQKDGFFSGFSFFKDYQINRATQDQSWKYIGEGLTFSYGVIGMKVLPFENGNSLIGLSIFECDYSPPGGLLMIDKNQSLQWVFDFDNSDLFGGAVDMVFTKDGIAVTLGEWEEVYKKILVSRSGELLDFDFNGVTHDITLETEFGYLAAKADQLELLNHDFSVLESYSLSEIKDIRPLGQQQFLICSNDGYYLLDENLMLTSLNILPQTYTTVWSFDTLYYAYQPELQQVDVLDTFFNIISSYPVLKGYTPKFGYQFGDKIMTAGPYTNNLNIWSYLQQTDAEELNFQRQKDIGITDIEIADSILVEYVNEPFFNGGWYRYYDYIHVEVTNYSLDTIDNYVIENTVGSGCEWCVYEFKTWYIDSLPIPPGQTVRIELGPYLQPCTFERPKEICLRTILPEDGVDAEVDNDMFCQSYSITIPTEELVPQIYFEIAPNPAHHSIKVSLEASSSITYDASVLTIDGILLSKNKVNGSFQLAVDNFSPGLYLLQISNEEGSIIKRFAVQ